MPASDYSNSGRRPNVRRKVTNFIARKGTKRSPRHENSYVLNGEVTCEELSVLQVKLEFSSDEEIDWNSFAVNNGENVSDGYVAYGMSGEIFARLKI